MESVCAALDEVAEELERRGATGLSILTDVVADKVNPDAYRKEKGRCPKGYKFDGDKCVTRDGGGGKKAAPKNGKPAKNVYKLPPEVREAKSIDDIPDGMKGIKKAIGHLGMSKFPPMRVVDKEGKVRSEGIDPKTIKFNLSGDVDSHAVMTWRDAKGRLQAAYSNTFKKRNAAKKWERVKKLEKVHGRAVKSFKKTLARKRGVSQRDQDAAAAMLLIAKTGLRPGGEAHLKSMGTRGIGTLSPENVKIDGDTITLDFVGKAKKQNTATVTDPELAAYLKKRMAAPASKDRLFASHDADLRKTMKASGMGDFKPKDFRTRRAGQLASDVFSRFDDPPPLPENEKKAKALVKKRVQEAAVAVSKSLNNTPAVAKSSYINPAIIQSWLKLVGGEKYATASINYVIATYQGKLGPGDLLSSFVGKKTVYVYRWVPDYADPVIRPGDYVLLDPNEGRHYGGRKGKRLTARVSTNMLEYRQGDEFIFVGPSPRRAAISAAVVKKPTMDQIYQEALKIELEGADQNAKPLDEEDPQLEEDPIPIS